MSCYERVNDFRINLTARKELGYGAQGTVYPGISLITKDPVAAKRTQGIWKEYFDKDEFEKEADFLLNRIPPHENIIKVLDFTKTEYSDEGIPKLDLWLITELCELRNLKEFSYSRDLSIEQKIELMYQSALAVRHLHGCKPESIAHRDVKPENILLTGNEENPTVKLCDFGSAKSGTRKDGKSMAMWSLAGTRRYLAPEQVECLDGHSKYDKQVDIFSLGITFLTLLKAVKGSLMSPETINEKGLGEIMWIKHKSRQAFTFLIHNSSDSSLVRAVKDVIMKMIRFEPSSRLSAADVVEELSKLRKGHPPPQPAPALAHESTAATVPQEASIPVSKTTHIPFIRKSFQAPSTPLRKAPATDFQTETTTAQQPTPVTVSQQAHAPVSKTATTTFPRKSFKAPATLPRNLSATVLRKAPATDTHPASATVNHPGPATFSQPPSTIVPPAETWPPGTKLVALFPFKAAKKDELSFEEYDVLTIIKSTADGPYWYEAEDQSGNLGLIPFNYVRRRREVHLQSTWIHNSMTWRQAHSLLIGEEIPLSMTKTEARQLLSRNDVGTFLVHGVYDDDEDKMVMDHKYTLHVVRPDGKVEYYRIFITTDGKFTINDRSTFESLQMLVHMYGNDANGLCTNLQKPLATKCDLGVCVDSKDFFEEGWSISPSEIHISAPYYKTDTSTIYKGEWFRKDVFIWERQDLLSAQDALIEAAVMTGLSHKNLVAMIGVVIGDATLIVTESLSQGRLSDYLRSRGRDVITNRDQVTFARDVCAGMQYLEEKQIMHRKLAAQSVLLSEKSKAKIGDFSFAHPRDLIKRAPQLLVKWTAPEVLKEGKCTTKSDMWSFGVLLWEIYNFGRQPYPRISNKNILSYVLEGERLEAPDGCPEEIRHVMLSAWDIDPAKRPTFSDVCQTFD